MTIVDTISKLGTTNEATNIDTIDRSLFVHQDTQPLSNGAIQSVYILKTGDPADVVTLTITARYDGKKNKSYFSLRLLSRQVQYDDATPSVKLLDDEVDAGVFFNCPGKGIADVDNAKSFIQNVASLMWGGVTTQEADSDHLTDLSFFLTQLSGLG
jgi:hypothetical protein